MRILIGYSYYHSFIDVSVTINSWARRLKKAGFDVETFPLTLNPPGHPLWWKQLDLRWQLGDKELLYHYHQLGEKLVDFDVFLNLNGINIHPDFVQKLNTFNVYACFDDPESSERLSKPVASAYDLCLVGNIAEVQTYKSWGCQNVSFWPAGFRADEFKTTLTEEEILTKERFIDITMLCEKKFYIDRIKRLDTYAHAFPQGQYFGNGWPNGVLDESKKIPLYQNTKIGPNFHNSTGPINYRVWTLPANGVMQLCDNKSHLGEIFKLGEEVVGFDTVDEAIELTHYFLNHEDERRKIALAGWKRTIIDYNEIAVFRKAVDIIKELISKKNKTPIQNTSLNLKIQRIKTIPSRVRFIISNHIKTIDVPQND